MNFFDEAKTIMKLRTLTTALITIGSFATGANAVILMTISDDGANLTLRATGSFDVTDAAVIGSGFLGADAAVAPLFNAFGFDTGANGVWYETNFTGFLTGSLNAYPSSTLTSNIPVWVDFDGVEGDPKFAAPVGILSGTVNETATFTGVTIESLGMVLGESVTGTWGLGGVNEQIIVTVIPEPSSAVFIGLGVLGLVISRRRIK